MLCNSCCHRHGLVKACCGDWWSKNKKLPRALSSWDNHVQQLVEVQLPVSTGLGRLSTELLPAVQIHQKMQSSAHVFSLNLLVFHLTKWSSKRPACFITGVNSPPVQHRELQAQPVSGAVLSQHPISHARCRLGLPTRVTLCHVSGNTHCMPGMPKGHPPGHSYLAFCDPSKSIPNTNAWLHIWSLYQHILSFTCNFQWAHHHLFTLLGEGK